MIPVELLQQLMQGGQLPQLPPAPQSTTSSFAPIPFEGGMPPTPFKGGSGLGGLMPQMGGTTGIMPFQKDAMMSAVMGQLNQPNFGVPQFQSPKRKLLGGLGSMGGGFGSGNLGGMLDKIGMQIRARR